ncbi:hypothetical protein C8R47DRAFT_1222235 [Mycena vitilis]|nr:hypothetical protein C8R47DRAFT_1222235 [Mycena vitilis]
MRMLPAEILGQIFIVCRDDDLNPAERPWFLPMSARWRMVTFGTPRLWNSVRLLTDAFFEVSASTALPVVAHTIFIRCSYNQRYLPVGSTNDNVPLTTIAAHVHDLLARCPALETAVLSALFYWEWEHSDPPPSRDTSTLAHLRHLFLLIALVMGIPILLDIEALLALSARSQFSLTYLSLVQQDLNLPQLASLLSAHHSRMVLRHGWPLCAGLGFLADWHQ